MHIIAFGDLHNDYISAKKIPDLHKADLVIITGDLTTIANKETAYKVIESIKSFNKNIMAIPGNMDTEVVSNYLDEYGLNLHGRGHIINNVGILGVGGSNPTPFNTPTEFSELELKNLLKNAYSEVKKLKFKLLVTHAPPFNTKTDKLNNGMHVGSSAVREFIETYQPDICITGHIHEAINDDWIGRCHVLNPGMINKGWYINISISESSIKATMSKIQ